VLLYCLRLALAAPETARLRNPRPALCARAWPSWPRSSPTCAGRCAPSTNGSTRPGRAGLNLADRFEDLARTVADVLDAAAPRGPAAPYWIGLDHDTYHARLAGLQRWADTVLCQHYGGYELRDCWPRHVHAV
jgi:hypothetical protein